MKWNETIKFHAPFRVLRRFSTNKRLIWRTGSGNLASKGGGGGGGGRDSGLKFWSRYGFRMRKSGKVFLTFHSLPTVGSTLSHDLFGLLSQYLPLVLRRWGSLDPLWGTFGTKISWQEFIIGITGRDGSQGKYRWQVHKYNNQKGKGRKRAQIFCFCLIFFKVKNVSLASNAS